MAKIGKGPLIFVKISPQLQVVYLGTLYLLGYCNLR